MRKFALVIALMSPALADAKPLPDTIICKVTGIWACGSESDGGICIEGGGQRPGGRYIFDIRKRRYTSPTGRGTISNPSLNESGLHTFTLGDGRIFIYENNPQQGDDGDYAMSYLRLTPHEPHKGWELRCKP